MKKLFALLLTAVMLIACVPARAAAEEPTNVYDLFSGLLAGRNMTLTVAAENVDLPEDLTIPADMVCTARQEEDTILMEITCGAETMVKATLTAEGAAVETALETLPSVECTWETLNPHISLTKDGDAAQLKISMTGPRQELLNFSVKVKGTELDNYAVSVQASLITGPGVIYGIYDDFSVRDGVSTRCAEYTWDESVLTADGEGEEICTVSKDGTLTITRTDACTVLLNDDEIGTVTFHSVLVLA